MPNSGKHNVNNIDSFFKVRPSRTTIREGETISFLEKGNLVKQEKRNGVVYETIYVEQGTQETKSTTTTTRTSSSGDITSVTAGTGLSGGGVAGPVTLNIDSTVATLTGTQTLTNKSIDLDSNTLTGTLTEFNTALQGDSFVSLTGTETLTNKTLAAPTFTGTAQGASLTLTGDLTVQGDTTTLNTATLQVEDNNIVLNYHASNDTSSTANGSGITIQDAVNSTTDATMLWNATNDDFDFSHTVTAPSFTGDLTGNADTATKWAAGVDINLSGDVAGSTGLALDGSGDVTIGATIQTDAVEAGMLNDNIISGQTAITTGLADTDELLLSDAGVLKKVDISVLESKFISGIDALTLANFNSDVVIVDSEVGSVTRNDSRFLTASATESVIESYGYTTNTGTVTSVAVSGGNGLTSSGGPITGSGTITLNVGEGTGIDVTANAISLDVSDVPALPQNVVTGDNFLVYNSTDGTALATVSELQSALSIPSISGTNDGVVTKNPNDTLTAESNLTFGGSALNLTGDLNISGYIYDSANSGNRLDLDDDSDAGQVNQVALYGINHLNLVADNTNNGTGEIRFWKGAVSDLDSGTNTRLMTIDNSGNVKFNAGDVKLSATKKLYLDGGGDSFIFEESANNVMFKVGNNNNLRFNSTGAIFNDAGLALDFRVEGDTDANLLFVDGSADRVGIGTTSPTGKLEVNSSDGTETLRLHKSDTNIVENEIIGEILFSTADSTLNADRKVIGAIKCFAEENYSGANSNEGSLQFFTTNATDLRHSAAPTPRMVIDEDGNIGIGTSSPGQKLHIGSRGTASDPTIATEDGLQFDFYNAGNPYQRKASIISNSADTSEAILAFWTTASSASATQKMTILGNGNVGIGTTSPSGKLNVELPQYVSRDTDAQHSIFSNSGDTGKGLRIGYDNSAHKAYVNVLDPGVAWGDLILQDSTGSGIASVGIGTSSPAYKVDISHSGEGLRLNSTGDLQIRFDRSGGNAFSIEHDTSRIYLYNRTTSLAAFAVNNSNNVGIGTVSPSFKFDVTQANNTVGIRTTDGTSEGVIGIDASANVFMGTRSNHNLVIRTNNSEVARIGSNGNVGIGTSSPQVNLDVTGSSGGDHALGLRAGDTSGTSPNSSQIILSYNGSAYNSSGYAHSIRTRHNAGGEAGNSIQFWLWDHGTDTASTLGSKHVMSIEGNGRVGIGTQSPGYKLDVSGNVRFTSDLRNEGRLLNSVGSSASPSYSFYSQGNAGMYRSGDGVGFSAAGSSVFDINSTRMYINTNVGIGTSSPSAKLDVVGSGNAGIEVTGGSGYVAGYFGTDFDYVAKFESFDASAAIVLEDSNSTGNYNRIGVATHDMFFVTNNSEAMRINSSGNVGIGTASPSEKLDVVGSAEINGLLYVSDSNDIPVRLSSTDADFAISMADSNSASATHNRIGVTTNDMKFFTNNVEALRIDSSQDAHFDQDVIAFSTTPSDKRLKKNIKDIDYGLDTIMKLNPKEYDWKKDDRHDIGFIAQEVEEVIPEIVKDKKHFDKEIKTLDYEKLTAVLIKAVQEQQEQINKLKEQLNG